MFWDFLKRIFGKQATYSDIANRAKSRGIEYLVHFTRMENLNGILEYGLKTRQSLENEKVNFYFNDSTRFDNFTNTISLSVTSPNYQMFWKYRQMDKSARWIIILLNAYQVLANLECAFNFTNASSNIIRKKSIAERKGLSAFDTMFYNLQGNRDICNLNKNETTDPQAEILCFSDITLKFFERIVFFNDNDRRFAYKTFKLEKIVILTEIFILRRDMIGNFG